MNSNTSNSFRKNLIYTIEEIKGESVTAEEVEAIIELVERDIIGEDNTEYDTFDRYRNMLRESQRKALKS